FPVQIQVDNGWGKSLTGIALDKHTMALNFGPDLAALDALRFGQELDVYGSRDTLRFWLKGTAVALGLTAKCIVQNTRGASQRDPFSVNSDPFGSGSRSTAGSESTEPTTAAQLVGFLTGSGLGEVRIMSDAERRKNFPNALYAWTSTGIFGAYTEYSL